MRSNSDWLICMHREQLYHRLWFGDDQTTKGSFVPSKLIFRAMRGRRGRRCGVPGERAASWMLTIMRSKHGWRSGVKLKSSPAAARGQCWQRSFRASFVPDHPLRFAMTSRSPDRYLVRGKDLSAISAITARCRAARRARVFQLAIRITAYGNVPVPLRGLWSKSRLPERTRPE